ncbi:MAG: hypothetical protein O9302_00285 [Cyclobacteriaceae bacterium]|jgi:hypothetical protein|nr:hypothetical protein [Cytophagales bacterium]MCZ8326468.1 hypothetical protein [Cyclobacteriaceae bacterium]
MANNWRITDGANYIAKSGHDSNAGTLNEPKKSLSTLLINVKNVIGAGFYIGNIPTAGTGSIFGDGKVIIDLNSGTLSCLSTRWDSIEIRNGSWALGSQTNISSPGFINSLLRNITGNYSVTSSLARRFRAFNTIFISCNFSTSFLGAAAGIIENSIIINSALTNFFTLQNSFVDFDSIVQGDNSTTFRDTFRNNNVRGVISLPITGGLFKQYAIQDQFIGTPQANGYAVGVNWLNESNLTADGYTGTVSGWNTAVATCINRDPRFNDVAGEDFTLQSDSPHIRRAVNGVDNIGGTKIARSVLNTDNNGTTVLVQPTSQIDTSVPSSYILNAGETEGYIDYIFDLGGISTLDFIDLKAELKFDSDFAGGSIQNENVPDSEPLTLEYAGRVNTSAAAAAQNQLVVPTGLISIGMFVRVAGEYRQVTGRTPGSPNDTITVASNFRATVGSGVTVTYGTANQIGALNPNRLTYQLRTSVQTARPVTNSEWDNDLDPAYLQAGTFFTQEWGLRPIYAIQGGVVYGGGDSERPVGATTQEIEARWLNVRVYLRDNYSSNGI